ncbi:MAG: hypothetical protein GY715_11890 [Planctomycetes bacterium]|nr:hypothetical protein [Planctomycetota bacterium]
MRLRAVLLSIVGLLVLSPHGFAADDTPSSSTELLFAGEALKAHCAEVKRKFKREYRADPELIANHLVFYERCVLMRNLMFLMHQEFRSHDSSHPKASSYWSEALASWQAVVQRDALTLRLRSVSGTYAAQMAFEFESFSIDEPWPQFLGKWQGWPWDPDPDPIFIGINPGKPGPTEKKLYLYEDLLRYGRPGTPGATETPVSLLDSLAAYLEIAPKEHLSGQSALRRRQDVWAATLERLPTLSNEQVAALAKNVDRKDLTSVVSLAALLRTNSSESLRALEAKVDATPRTGNSLIKQVIQNQEAPVDNAWLSYQLWREGGAFKRQPVEIKAQGQSFQNCVYMGHDVLGGKPRFIIGATGEPAPTAEIKFDPMLIRQIRVQEASKAGDGP